MIYLPFASSFLSKSFSLSFPPSDFRFPSVTLGLCLHFLVFHNTPRTSMSQRKNVSPSTISNGTYQVLSSALCHQEQQKINMNGELSDPPVPAPRKRWIPNKEQREILEHLRQSEGLRYPSVHQINEIVERLMQFGNVQEKNVRYWFQNFNANMKRKQKRQELQFQSTHILPFADSSTEVRAATGQRPSIQTNGAQNMDNDLIVFAHNKRAHGERADYAIKARRIMEGQMNYMHDRHDGDEERGWKNSQISFEKPGGVSKGAFNCKCQYRSPEQSDEQCSTLSTSHSMVMGGRPAIPCATSRTLRLVFNRRSAGPRDLSSSAQLFDSSHQRGETNGAQKVGNNSMASAHNQKAHVVPADFPRNSQISFEEAGGESTGPINCIYESHSPQQCDERCSNLRSSHANDRDGRPAIERAPPRRLRLSLERPSARKRDMSSSVQLLDSGRPLTDNNGAPKIDNDSIVSAHNERHHGEPADLLRKAYRARESVEAQMNYMRDRSLADEERARRNSENLFEKTGGEFKGAMNCKCHFQSPQKCDEQWWTISTSHSKVMDGRSTIERTRPRTFQVVGRREIRVSPTR